MLIDTRTAEVGAVHGLPISPTLNREDFEASPVFLNATLWNDGPHGTIYKVTDGLSHASLVVVSLTFVERRLALLFAETTGSPREIIHWRGQAPAPQTYSTAGQELYAAYHFAWGIVQTMEGPTRPSSIVVTYDPQQRLLMDFGQ